jgi:predicted kinase
LNLYLQHSGDYDGLPVLRFYLVYRALVRAKVAAIALSQHHTSQQEAELAHYLVQAERFVRPHAPGLILAHGFSGCGKTWLSSRFMTHPWVIRLRSDIERLRHFSDVEHQAGVAGVGTGRYSAEMTAATYTHLQHLARKLLQAQFTVIIDATFLQQGQRRLMYELAAACHAPLLLVSLEADTATLQQRIRARQQAGRDASEADLAVLAYQLQHHDPLSAQERTHSLCLDTTRPMDPEAIWAEIQARLSNAPADPRRKSLKMS